MVFAVESLFPDHPEDLPPTDFNVGDVFESFETEDIDEAKDWAWQKMEEGYSTRMWRR